MCYFFFLVHASKYIEIHISPNKNIQYLHNAKIITYDTFFFFNFSRGIGLDFLTLFRTVQ